MRLSELRQLMRELSEMGFVKSERTGSTGIGHTLEEWLGVSENNLPIPDLSGRVEIKATRTTTNNLITLFTFNKSVWQLTQSEVIERWGYFDEGRQRYALYSMVSATEVNPQGLRIILPDGSDTLSVIDAESEEVLATWDIYSVVGKFMSKFERLLFVRAEPRMVGGVEEFHYLAARLLTEPNSLMFRKSFLAGKGFIDIRMHLRPNGSVRNHGTGFRIREQDLPSFFGLVEDLLPDA